MAEKEVVIVDAVRTAFGRMGGTLKDIYASKLGAIGIDGLLNKTKIMEKAHVDSVFLGSATGCSQSGNPARHAMLGSALGYETSASYVEMQCGSAIDSINHAAWKILANQADIIIAGGMESYSQMAIKFSMATPPYKLIPPMPIPPQLSPVAEECIGMGITAENLQEKYDIPREASDEFAYNSQMRAKAAMEAGYFEEEIVPVTIPATRKTPEYEFKVDEHPRPTVNPGRHGQTAAGFQNGRHGNGWKLLGPERRFGLRAHDEWRKGQRTGIRTHGQMAGRRGLRLRPQNHGYRAGLRHAPGH